MKARSPVTITLTILAYVATTFAVQGASHFAINADHYAEVSFLRAEPIVPMGLAAMLVQGTIFALLFPALGGGSRTIRRGLLLSWAIGAFLASYIALGEAGKYAVPSIPAWIGVEVASAAVQFTAFGLLLGWIHRNGGAVGVRRP